MHRTGIADLPLHYGRAPSWLFQRMVKLAEGIVSVMVHEFGADEMLCRLADPFWFQALSCVLGFDWHSSGTTTVTSAALKSAIKPDVHGLAVLGGKGSAARAVPEEIGKLQEIFDINVEQLRYASKMTAKVDNTAIQDNHKLYQHAFFISESGNWAVVQQGMNVSSQYARRYHWLGDHVKSFVVEPHEAIMGNAKLERVLNMTSRESEDARRVSVDLAKEPPAKLEKMLKSIRGDCYQKTLLNWMEGESEAPPALMVLPRRVDWEALKQAYEFQPKNYEELLAIKGIGPATVRALALISELIYGKSPSWRDPVKYSFAVGGKDGVPYPVDRETMDRTIEVIKTGVEEAKVGKAEKLNAIRRLKDFLPPL